MIKINAKHVNPFVEAAMRVVEQIAGIEVRRGHLSYTTKVQTFGVSIIIGIYGYLAGQIVYSLDGILAERIVDKMLEGKSPQEKKILFLDAIGELANMITGNATALLNQRRDQVLSITTPVIAAGANLSVHLVPKPSLIVGLVTQYGRIEISIAVEERQTLQETDSTEGILSET